MKIVIVGAGAVGAYMGARLARTGQDVTLFARGAHLRAMQERGVRVLSADSSFEARPNVAGDLQAIGPADLIILGVKAHALTDLAPRLPPLFREDTVVLSTQNGLPWWYFQRLGGAYDGLRLERVDPAGVIASAIEPERVIGSIVYFSTAIVEPGVVQHIEGQRLSLGEPDGSRSDRVRRVAEVLGASGLRAPITTRIRHEIWVKLLGNVSLNPVSALTGATLVDMVRDAEGGPLIREMMTEADAVAARLGIELPVSIDQRMAGAEKVGAHKTSMLQDVEAGRPMELDAVVGGVLELGERLGVPMPATRAIYACAKLLDRTRAQLRERELIST